MKILLTGHSGLLGNTLLKKLKEQGHTVFGISRTDRYNISENITCADLTNTELCESLIMEIKPEVVYHLAANASESKGQVSPVDMVQRNLLLSTNVLKSSINAGVKKFVFASSISVYGDAPTPYKEDGITVPKDVYGVNKLAFEQVLKIMSKVHGIKYTIFRPHNIYGIGQNMADPTKNVIALFMRKLLLGEPYNIYGEGLMKRAFSYVDDVADAFIRGLQDDMNEITVNVGSQTPITIAELSDLLQIITEKKSEITYLPLRSQEMSDFVADHHKQGLILSTQQTSLAEGLKKTWDWVQSQPLPELVQKENEIYG